MLTLIAQAAGFGGAAAATIGPWQLFIFSKTLLYGLRRTWFLLLTPLASDLPLIVVATFVLSAIDPLYIRAIQAAGGLFVLWIAWGAWRNAAAFTLALEADGAPPADARYQPRALFGQLVLINLLSPGAILFWVTVNGPLLAGALRQSWAHGAAFLVSFYGTFIGLAALMTVGINTLRALDVRWLRLGLRGAALALLALALMLLASAAGLLV
jgi:threonine/homoserine/homoserine lactone efflux protein